MKKSIKRLFCSLLLITPIINFAGVTAPLTLPHMLKKVLPAIVNISVESVHYAHSSDFLPGNLALPDEKLPLKAFSVGSGVIFNAKKGLIITNAHVVKDAKVVVVTLKDGERMHADVVKTAPSYDIAILKISAQHLIALPIGDSAKLEVGQQVTAIGSPYGLSQTVTTGIVSALHRTHPHIEGYQSFIQTDAPINPGNSGGALVNSNGKLIGINTAIVAPTAGSVGLGFAIPSNMVKKVVHQLLTYGKIKHGMLGVMVQNLTPTLAQALDVPVTHGAIISQVLPNTPAAKAQLKPEEVITQVNRHTIYSSIQLKNETALIPPGTHISLTYYQSHKKKHANVIIGDPENMLAKKIKYFSGMDLQNLSELSPSGEIIRGVLVTKVSDSSPGQLAGIMPGDVIITIDGKMVDTVQSVKAIVKTHTRPLILHVMRKSHQVLMMLREN